MLKKIFTQKYTILISLAVISILSLNCCNNHKKTTSNQPNEIHCTNEGCEGTYTGVEFKDGKDIAHQFSNNMSAKVGNELKKLYKSKKYSKVDFSKIKMSTEGMGTGTVIYKLNIPFVCVKDSCNAYTSFDHVGGWNHNPELKRRKKELQSALLPNENLDISALKSTPEGLQEYWIQWKNKTIQKNCHSK